MLWSVLATLAWLGLSVLPARANRFGPPWQSRVVVDRATLFGQPDAGSAPVGPLVRGQIVVVVNETTAADGTAWTQVPDGWIRSSEIAEDIAPWVAEVSVPSASIYARPNTREPIRRTVKQGDLLRVTGASPGIEGDGNTWWATTEGYVGLHTLRAATSGWANGWALPDGADAPGGWWGAIRSQANVRAAATTRAPIVGSLVPGDRVKVLEEVAGDAVGGNATWYRIDGGRLAGAHVHSSLIDRQPDPEPSIVPPDREVGHDPWIVVDRAASTLTLLRDGQPRFTTYVSLGKAGVETPEGTYSTFIKYRADRMTSTTVPDAEHAYDLPNVPFTEYFKADGSAIHGTYWHDAFGTTQSQGCINLTWTDSEYVFDQTRPQIPGDQIGFAIDPAQATPVVIIN